MDLSTVVRRLVQQGLDRSPASATPHDINDCLTAALHRQLPVLQAEIESMAHRSGLPVLTVWQ